MVCRPLLPALGVLIAALVGGGAARAQSTGSDGVPQVVQVPIATLSQPGATFAGTAGYGFTESVIDGSDAHHRIASTLTATVTPVAWLTGGVRFDGRYDAHTGTQGNDDGAVGDPRVFVRAAFRPVPMLGLGLHAGVWFPSELAPSVTPGAITPEFMAFGSIHLRVPLVLTLSAGYRVDRSAAAVPDAASWSAADRVAGGINAFHAVLLGAGGAYRVGAVEILAEWTWDLLVGDRAPSPEYSPMHVRAGLRWQPMPLRRLFASLVLDGTLSARPSVAADAPLVSIDPRVGAFLTLAIGIPFAQPSVTSTRASVSSSAAPPVAAAAETTARAALEGRVLAEDGTPVAGAVVRATPANGAPVEVTTDEQGHYGLDGLPPGTYDLSISAARRPEVHHSVTVVAGQHGTQDAALDRPFPAGQIRGLVRSFDGTPVVATIEIERIHLRQQTDARGEFECDARPGEYVVQVSAPGFHEQRRRVTVVTDGVIVLNVDLQRARP